MVYIYGICIRGVCVIATYYIASYTSRQLGISVSTALQCTSSYLIRCIMKFSYVLCTRYLHTIALLATYCLCMYVQPSDVARYVVYTAMCNVYYNNIHM